MRRVIMCLRRPRRLDTVRLRNASASISFRGYSITPTSLASSPHRTTRTPPFAKRKHSATRYFSTSLATAFVAKATSDSVPTNSARMSEESKFYTFKPELPGDKTYDFEQLRGNVVLVVNVASKCGFTPQYKGLQKLYEKYKDRGLVILGFPCNQFGGQEPGSDEEISQFCELNHGVTFPLMKKSDVNGDNTNDVYKWLKEQKAGIFGLTRIKWNFEKFLINQKGEVVHRWASTTSPDSIDAEIEKLFQNPPN